MLLQSVRRLFRNPWLLLQSARLLRKSIRLPVTRIIRRLLVSAAWLLLLRRDVRLFLTMTIRRLLRDVGLLLRRNMWVLWRHVGLLPWRDVRIPLTRNMQRLLVSSVGLLLGNVRVLLTRNMQRLLMGSIGLLLSEFFLARNVWLLLSGVGLLRGVGLLQGVGLLRMRDEGLLLTRNGWGSMGVPSLLVIDWSVWVDIGHSCSIMSPPLTEIGLGWTSKWRHVLRKGT